MRNLLSAITLFSTFAFVIYLLCRQRAQHIAYIHAELESYWDASNEKRRFKRFKRHLPVDCIVPEKPGDIYKTFSHDISGSGICLSVPEIMPEGSRIGLKIAITDKKQINITGEIVWMREATSNNGGQERKFNAGVKFSKIDKKDKKALDNFLIESVK
jgi:c-di-GMP-binding flagellar brake protein YcgR